MQVDTDLTPPDPALLLIGSTHLQAHHELYILLP